MLLEIPMYQGYGLTEASPVISTNSAGKHKLGSSGALSVIIWILRYAMTRVKRFLPVKKGEIVIRGGNVMYGLLE